MVSFSATLRLTIMINVPQTIILVFLLGYTYNYLSKVLRLKTALFMRSFK